MFESNLEMNKLNSVVIEGTVVNSVFEVKANALSFEIESSASCVIPIVGYNKFATRLAEVLKQGMTVRITGKLNGHYNQQQQPLIHVVIEHVQVLK